MSASVPDPATAREDLCRYLSACYYEPDAAFARERLFEAIVAAARQIDPALAEGAARLGEAFAAHDLQTLLVDYTSLFIGPQLPLARPYGSSWAAGPGAPGHDPLESVLALYRQAGFEIAADFQELPDHVAVALEFLYLLAYRQNQARRSGDHTALAAAQQLQRRFLVEHLGVWIGRFGAAVRSGAQTAFYRELAGLTEGLVRTLMADPTAPAAEH